MKRPHASDDVRERALAAVDTGKPVVDVAAFFQVDPSTVRRWRRQRQVRRFARTAPRSGRPRKISPDLEHALRAQVAAQPDAILAWHCAEWARTQESTVSISTMGRCVRALGFTLKDPDCPGAGRGRTRCLARRVGSD